MKIKKLNNFFNKLVIKKNKTISSNRITLSEPNFDNKELFEVLKVFKSTNFSSGKNVLKFENQFAKKMGMKYGLATNSGSSANLLSLLSLKKIYKIKNGSEVIIPASTFATVAMPILQAGLIPVYVDVDLDTLNINVNEIKKAITKKTKIIMPVHTLGLPCEMIKISKLAKEKNLIVFEDCCEAHGAKIGNKFVGSFGKISAFSFYIAHNMTTIEGGMILTNNKDLYLNARSMREFGRIKNYKKRYYSDKYIKDYDVNYIFNSLGYNLRMSEIQAALGLVQLKKLNKFNYKRIKLANYLEKKILKFSKYLFTTKKLNKNVINTYYTFPFLITNKAKITRRKICEYLEEKHIQTRPMMAGCLPDQPAFRNEPGRIVGKLKNSRYIRDKCFFVGIHPKLNYSNLDYLLNVLSKIKYER